MPRRINWRKARARANETAVGAKTKNGRTESCGNGGSMETVESQSRLPPVSTDPWKSRREQARFPHFHSSGDEADGKVENQKQVSHFPTAIYLSQNKKPGTVGRASPSARRMALRATQGSKSNCR